MKVLDPLKVRAVDWPLGHIGEFGRDPLGFLIRCARSYGDSVELRFVNCRVYLLSDAGAIESILVKHSSFFRKSITYRTPFMRRMFGHGIFTSEGALWGRQRKLVQAWLQGERIHRYFRLLSEETELTMRQWDERTCREIYDDMQWLTLRSFGRFLIRDVEPVELRAQMSASMATKEQFANQFSWQGILGHYLPLASDRHHRRVVKHLHRLLQSKILNRRQQHRKDDYLGYLIDYRDEHGCVLDDRLIRDEVITLLFGGSETPASALTWGLFLLASHPQILARAREEIVSAGDGSPCGKVDVRQLPLLANVVRETMRLYPPVWVIGREASRTCRIDGFDYKKGDVVIMSQWVLHRDPRYFERPEQFDPDRWNDPAMIALPRFACFPFGGGPRICPGRSFAELAVVQVLAQLLQRFRIELARGSTVEPLASITLLPKGGAHAVVEPYQV